jgi:hypothetical protein
VNVGIVEAIPWTFTDSPGVLLWVWMSKHFVARITGYEAEDEVDVGGRRLIRSYHWDLSDLIRTNQGLPRLLIEGTSTTFEDAELRVREHVGKCYDARLGYRKFSGTLPYTFTISTGESVDVAEYIGTRCAVTVLMPDGTTTTVSGDLDVHHYRWRLASPEQVLEIVPEHVVRITNRSEAAERASAITRSDTYSGVGRLYREEPGPGCTGQPGFMVGTVDHAGAPRCPIHESGVPDHLLR